ncbi:MAG: hypothetical protein ACMXYK_01340 [Candidatus Woesearchaeota archaeon]
MHTKIHKKGQIKIFESIAVLVIFVFLVAIGISFYTNMQMNQLDRVRTSFSRLDAVKTSVVLSNMPEIACSNEGVIEVTCKDLYKVLAWQELTDTDVRFIDYYFRHLGQSLVEIQMIYPTSNTITVYNNTLDRADASTLLLPTVLHNPSTGRDQLGMLFIRSYYR